MRKVTQETASAFATGRSRSVGNTAATPSALLLHGHPIATLTTGQDGPQVTLDDCGWQTVTTKERLNGLLEVLRSPLGIFQKAGRWYIFNANNGEVSPWPGSVTINVCTHGAMIHKA